MDVICESIIIYCVYCVHIVYIVCGDSILVILPLYNTAVGFKSVSEDVIEA